MGLSFLEGEQDDILGRDFRILAPWRRQRRWSGLGRSGNTAGIRWARPDPRRARTQAGPTSLPGNAGSGGRAEAEGEALALVREGRTQALGSGGRGWEWWPCVAQPRGRDCVTARRAPVCVRPDANACESLRILATMPRHFRGEEREPQVWGSSAQGDMAPRGYRNSSGAQASRAPGPHSCFEATQLAEGPFPGQTLGLLSLWASSASLAAPPGGRDLFGACLGPVRGPFGACSWAEGWALGLTFFGSFKP